MCAPTFTNRRLYLMRCAARPFGFFFLSAFATFGVWPRTLPARAKDPCTLPARQRIATGQARAPRSGATAAAGGGGGRGAHPWRLQMGTQVKESDKPPAQSERSVGNPV